MTPSDLLALSPDILIGGLGFNLWDLGKIQSVADI